MSATQPTLFDTGRRPRRLTLQEKFDHWIAQNPGIVDLFLRYANEARDRGLPHYGIGAITEVVRWHVMVQTHGDDFKINNNWRSRLARLLVQRDPRLEGFFHFRKLTTR